VNVLEEIERTVAVAYDVVGKQFTAEIQDMQRGLEPIVPFNVVIPGNNIAWIDKNLCYFGADDSVVRLLEAPITTRLRLRAEALKFPENLLNHLRYLVKVKP